MDKRNQAQLEQAMLNAKASMEISGFTITPEMDKLVKQKLNGELTHEEFLEKAYELAVRKKKER